MTTSVNPTLSNDEIVFKNLIWTPLIMAGEDWLFTAVPILNAHVLGSIDKEVITVMSDFLFEKFRLLFDINSIKFINSAHQSVYEASSLQLKIILNNQGQSSNEFQSALTKAIADQIALTRVSQ